MPKENKANNVSIDKRDLSDTNDMFPHIRKAVLPPMKIMFPCHLKHTMKENAPILVRIKSKLNNENTKIWEI
jgi:hypothetical protein